MEQCCLPNFFLLVNEKDMRMLRRLVLLDVVHRLFLFLLLGTDLGGFAHLLAERYILYGGAVMKSMCDIVRTTDAIWAPELPRVF